MYLTGRIFALFIKQVQKFWLSEFLRDNPPSKSSFVHLVLSLLLKILALDHVPDRDIGMNTFAYKLWDFLRDNPKGIREY